MSSASPTLYDEVGGKPAVVAIVDDFYERLLADPSLARYFSGKDMRKLKSHQQALVTVALGGTSQAYVGKMMAPAHADLSIDDTAFDSVLAHLESTLNARDIRPVTVEKIIAILEALRDDVVQTAAARA